MLLLALQSVICRIRGKKPSHLQLMDVIRAYFHFYCTETQECSDRNCIILQTHLWLLGSICTGSMLTQRLARNPELSVSPIPALRPEPDLQQVTEAEPSGVQLCSIGLYLQVLHADTVSRSGSAAPT